MKPAPDTKTKPKSIIPMLDLRENALLPAGLQQRYNALAHEIKPAFNDCMDSLTRHFNHAPQWLFTLPANRNPLASSIFHCAVTTRLAQALQQEGTLPKTVIAHSKTHAELLQTALGASVTVQTLSAERFHTIHAVCMAVYQLIRTLLMLIIAKFIAPPAAGNLPHPKILLDTFILPGQADQNRYYPGMIASLSPQDQKLVRFVPTLFGVTLRNAHSFIRSIRAAAIPYLLREDYLTVLDVFRAWLASLRGQFLTIPSAPCLDMDLSNLIRQDLLSFREFGAAMTGHLAQQAFSRFRDAGIVPDTLVDWFENQPVDRGWNLGAQQAFPNATRIGYQAFPLIDLYVSSIPTCEEYAAGIIPDVITPLGLNADAFRSQCPCVSVERAPSFRFSHLFAHEQQSGSRQKKDFDIFAPLSMAEDEAIPLISTLCTLKACFPELSIAVRPHPASSRAIHDSVVAASMLHCPAVDFAEMLDRSAIIVGNGSSTCLEALLKGVYVIVVNTRGLLANPIPETVPDSLYQICFSDEELVCTIERLRKDPSLQQRDMGLAASLLKACMTPVTPETVRRFLRLTDTTAISRSASIPVETP